jgi:hypothetical protein
MLQTIFHFAIDRQGKVKALSTGMDLTESTIHRQAFIKGRGTEMAKLFSNFTVLNFQLLDHDHLIQPHSPMEETSEYRSTINKLEVQHFSFFASQPRQKACFFLFFALQYLSAKMFWQNLHLRM